MAAPNIQTSTNPSTTGGNESGVKVGAAADQTLGFYGATGVAKPTVTGARDETEGALKNLIAALAAQGLIVDGTTAS
jgi:hypothetical protein